MLDPTNYTITDELLQAAINSLPNIDSRLALNEPSGDFFTDHWLIKSEFKGTVWEQILDSLVEPKGEARLIKMGPGECYPSHADIDDRWHLTITGNCSYLIDLDSTTMYPTEPTGKWYLMDAGKRHSAANFGSEDRIQLVVRKLLPSGMINNPVDITLRLRVVNYDYRFIFDDIVSPWLNRAYKQGIVNRFKTDGQLVNITISKEYISELEEKIKEHFTIDEY
jgi:hypothetical protein